MFGLNKASKTKLELLNREYDNFQHYLKTGEDRGVYSATKQQGRGSSSVRIVDTRLMQTLTELRIY